MCVRVSQRWKKEIYLVFTKGKKEKNVSFCWTCVRIRAKLYLLFFLLSFLRNFSLTDRGNTRDTWVSKSCIEFSITDQEYVWTSAVKNLLLPINGFPRWKVPSEKRTCQKLRKVLAKSTSSWSDGPSSKFALCKVYSTMSTAALNWVLLKTQIVPWLKMPIGIV